MRLFRSAFVVAVLAALASGCSDDPTADPRVDPVPDFALQDVNPTSASFDQAVSPRDYLRKVSAWYFGFAT